MKTIAIIPARGGSKSIPKKNIALLAGKPLIAYAIELGLSCPLVDRTIVSTDSPEIAEVARKYGAEAPFLRPAEIARDDTPDLPVFLHLISWLKEHEGYEFDYLVNLRCTTPLKRREHLEEAIRIAAGEECDSVRTVTRIVGKNHPYWMFKKDERGFVSPFISGVDLRKYYQRQLLPPAYSINALVDVMKTTVLLGPDAPYGERILPLEIEAEYCVDIDAPSDLFLCEAAMTLLQNKRTPSIGAENQPADDPK